MKKVRKLWALLLALALVISYMPVATYAADAPTVKSLKLSSGFKITGNEGCVADDLYYNYEGNSYTVTYSDGKTETYKFVDDESKEMWGFYCGSKEGWLERSFAKDPRLSSSNKTVTLKYYDDASETYAETTAAVTIEKYDGNLKSLEYIRKGGLIEGTINPATGKVEYFAENQNEYKTFEGDVVKTIRSIWDEDAEKYVDETNTYTCTKTGEDEDGWEWYDFVNDDDPGDYLYLKILDDQWKTKWAAGETHTLTVVDDNGITAKGGPQVKVSSKQNVQADPQLSKYRFTYDGKKHSVKVKSVDVGYWDENSQEFVILDTLKSGFKVTLNEKGKKIGDYEIHVTVDTDKYKGEGSSWFTIAPKNVKIKSVKAGKKKFTVKWKKPSKKELKNIDGYLIIYSTSKNFGEGKTETKKVSKNKTSVTIKKLKSKKKYYVVIATYKKCKDKYGKYEVWSEWSKTKKVKTK